jgi:glycosyltransferase involved in cell wall biosynthesis
MFQSAALSIRQWWRNRLAPPAEPSALLVADGAIPTVELVRQVLDATGLFPAVPVRLGAECYSELAAVGNIKPNCLHVLVRTSEAGAFPFVQRLRAIGLPYCYVLDDNFWLLLEDDPELHRYYQNPFVRSTIEAAVAGADVVLCYSELFRDFLSAFNSNVAVVPAAFDFSLIENLPAVPAHGEMRIGIVANRSRAEDIAFLTPVVEQVLAARPVGVVFEFFGYTPPELQGHRGVRSLPPVSSYAEYLAAKMARGWLLGLAPLNGGRFAEYKTNNKLREFGACSIAAVYSDSRVYRECVEDGHTGWLVPNDPARWTAAVLTALADPAATREIGRRAHDYVRRHHQMDAVAQQWAAALAPTVERVEAGYPQARRRCKQMALLGRRPPAAQTFTAEGAQTVMLPGEAEGVFQRHALLRLDPGEAIAGETSVPLAGPYRLSCIVATYRARLQGSLVVRVEDDAGLLSSAVHDLADLPDGSTLTIPCELRKAGGLWVTVTSHASGRLALYGLSSRGRTTFTSSGFSAPVGFAV